MSTTARKIVDFIGEMHGFEHIKNGLAALDLYTGLSVEASTKHPDGDALIVTFSGGVEKLVSTEKQYMKTLEVLKESF